MKTKHTATPWATRSEGPQWFVHQSSNEWELICNTLHGNDEANAKFICRAVNSHEKLLEALKPLAEQDCDSWGCEYTIGYETKRFPDHNCPPARARTAITKAEGGNHE